MLKQKIRDELKQSMLARTELKTSVLRMLLSAINYYEIQKGGAGYEATDEDVLAVIQKEAKQTISEINATTVAEIGKVMGALMPKIKGKADGGLVSKIVKEELSK